MGYLSRKFIVREMALRKLMFHKDENWSEIRLWGLFYAGDIRKYIDKGELISYGKYGKRCLGWYYPSKEFYEKYILPEIELIDKENYSKVELGKLRGQNWGE